MKKDLGVKTYIYPQPVLIISTYNEDGSENAMNAAWGGICDYDKVFIILSEHKTTTNLLKTNGFVINIGDKNNVMACDYVGIVSANQEKNKFAKAGFTASKSKYVNAPIINELKLALECEVVSYENEILIGKIKNVCADESILDENNKINVSKLSPITYDPCNHNYIALGDIVDKAFSCGKKIK